MRQLSQEELELITGGMLSTIVVTAQREDWSWQSPYIPNDPYDNPGGGSNTGGGGTAPTPPPCRSADASSTHSYSNELASELTRSIRGMSEYKSHEYLGFIYRDSSGALRSSGLIEGHSQGATWDPGRFSIPENRIVGFIHNHPSNTYASGGLQSAEARTNRNPSDNDWIAADRVVSAGGDASQLTLYVIGPDNVMREFSYSAKASYANPDKNTTPGPVVSQTLQPSTCN